MRWGLGTRLIRASRRQSFRCIVQVRYTGGGSFYYTLINPCLITLPGVVACSDDISRWLHIELDQYRDDAAALCFPHCEMLHLWTGFQLSFFAYSVCYENKIAMILKSCLELYHFTAIRLLCSKSSLQTA